MKTYRKALLGITTAMVLAGTTICATAYAGEAPQTTETAAVETTKTFTTQDGILSIQIPMDDDSWKVIDDPNSWFVVSDGTDMIIVNHIANGDLLPAAELANEQYAEIYQVFYSTLNEVFVVTGRIANKDEAQTVKDAVNSFQVLKYDTVQKTKEAPQPAPNPQPAPEDELIADGKIFTGNHMDLYTPDGFTVTLSELNQGGWANEETGEIFHRGPADGNFWYGDRGTTLSDKYPDDDLINGGRIFTGNYIELFNEYGGLETLSELSQGGWANEETGEIFFRNTVGEDFWYGDQGTILTPEFDGGGYAGNNYYENEYGEFSGDDYEEEDQGGYAGDNYYQNEYGEFSEHDYGEEDQGGYAGANYYQNEYGEFFEHDYGEEDQGGYAGANYYQNEYGEFSEFD